MKKKYLFLSLVSLFSLSSCAFIDAIKDIFNGGDNNTPGDSSTDKEHEPPKEKTKIGEFYGGLSGDSRFYGYEFSKSTEAIKKPKTGTGTIQIASFNDFHGSVKETYNEAGLTLMGSFIKKCSQQENTLVLDQGDTWQGSFESNHEYGAIVQDVFNYAGVSVRTVGNHDFDWGLSHLESTNNRKLGEDYIPTLAANVFDYGEGREGNVQQSQYGKEYATFILDNGIKVGIVGVIGESQITSICSQLVSTVKFIDHIAKIKDISDYLRYVKDCDVIIASAHEGSPDLLEKGLTDVSPLTHKRYVDLVLGGHKHTNELDVENEVRFVQSASNGIGSGITTLEYNFETDSLIDGETFVTTYDKSEMASYCDIDPTIEQMVSNCLTAAEPLTSEVLNEHFSGSFDTSALARVMTEAIYDRVSKSVDIDFACCNYARDGFKNSTEFTYGDLYRCFPFDNQIILMDVSSYYGRRQIGWNFGYRGDTSLDPETAGTYKCAVVDYIALHQDENREYDKFPDANDGYQVFNDTDGDAPTYRDILYSYLKEHPDKLYKAYDYSLATGHFVG